MKSKPNPARDLLVGTWKGVDEWSTNIEYTVRRRNAGYTVLAIDTSDDEKAVRLLRFDGHRIGVKDAAQEIL